nr:hypothetical protein [uncultured Duganella sp.]
MEALIRFDPAFPLQGLMDIGDYLQEQDVLVPDYPDPDLEVYFVANYLAAQERRRMQTILLPDRNVVSRMQQAARGLPLDKQGQTAAAILAFAQGLDILIEPSIAFHEMAFNEGNTAALEELKWFRVADNGHLPDWIALGLGEQEQVSALGQPQEVAFVDLAKPPKRWRMNYIAMLKIAELELETQHSPAQKVTTLLKWMRDDFILAGPAAVLALLYFAPNSPPRKGLLKSLRSADRQGALAGVKNAAWDLTYLSDFARRIDEQDNDAPIRYIFATFDKRLRDLARYVIGEHAELDASQSLARSFERWWRPQDAQHLANLWANCMERTRAEKWWEQFRGQSDYVGALIARGEAALLNWTA